MLDLSIVIPAYNAEEYIEECIDSILKQNLENYEVIIIEDYSKDTTKEKLIKYQKEKNIKIIFNSENKGQAFCRNLGLKKSKGKYILFLDSDDYLYKGTLDKFIIYLRKNADIEILTFDFYNLKKNKIKYIKRKLKEENIMTGKEFLKETFLKKESYPMPWLYLYNKDFLIENKLYFNEKMRGEEDCELYIKIMFLAKKVMYKNIALIYYRESFNGQSKNKRDRSKNYLIILETYREKLEEVLNDNELKQGLINYMGYIVLNIIKNKIKYKNYSYLIKNKQMLVEILLENSNLKYKLLGKFLSLF